MAEAPTGTTLSARLREEHHRIFTLVSEMEALSTSRADVEEWLREVTHRLMELGELLAPHFRFERDSALYAEAPLRAPHIAARLDKLLGEHQTFLTELGAILALARGTMDPDEALRIRVRERLATLFQTMRLHEANENEVLGSVFQDDIGVQD